MEEGFVKFPCVIEILDSLFEMCYAENRGRERKHGVSSFTRGGMYLTDSCSCDTMKIEREGDVLDNP